MRLDCRRLEFSPHLYVPSQLTLPAPVVSASCWDDVVAAVGRGSVA